MVSPRVGVFLGNHVAAHTRSPNISLMKRLLRCARYFWRAVSSGESGAQSGGVWPSDQAKPEPSRITAQGLV